jgi:hypothetical protein
LLPRVLQIVSEAKRRGSRKPPLIGRKPPSQTPRAQKVHARARQRGRRPDVLEAKKGELVQGKEAKFRRRRNLDRRCSRISLAPRCAGQTDRAGDASGPTRCSVGGRPEAVRTTASLPTRPVGERVNELFLEGDDRSRKLDPRAHVDDAMPSMPLVDLPGQIDDLGPLYRGQREHARNRGCTRRSSSLWRGQRRRASHDDRRELATFSRCQHVPDRIRCTRKAFERPDMFAVPRQFTEVESAIRERA